MKKSPTYTTFGARVYKVQTVKKRLYVFYDWKAQNSTQWIRVGANGQPFSWSVPNTTDGNEAYDKLIRQIHSTEIEQLDDGANIVPPVEFEVTMKQEHRGQYLDEYTWQYAHRQSEMPSDDVSCYEANFSMDE